ncbi:MAG: CapA family protein [Sphingomonadaceae bacterium]
MIGGDTHFGENYARTGTPGAPAAALSDEQRYQGSLAALKPFAEHSAFALVNLETPMSPELSDGLTDKDYVHWTIPAKAVPALVAAGIDAVGLGNNHSYDQGESGLRKSLVALQQGGIRSFGANTSQSTAQAPLLQELTRPGGAKVMLAVFGMLEERPVYRDKYGFYAGTHRAGVAPVDLAGFRQQVAMLRKRYGDLYVVAYPHWGENYAWAKDGQVDLGRELIDAGADIVIGQHGHTLQEIERYHGRWILYGIGNFDFLAPGRYQRFAKIQPFSLIVRLSFGADPKAPPAVRLYPILSDNRTSGFRPRPASATEATSVLSAIQSRRKSIGFDARLLVDDPLGPAFELRRRRWAGVW